MNTTAFSTQPPESILVDYVDLKWLMAGEGHRIDLARLQSDLAYVRQCLALAMRGKSDVLRQLAGKLLGQMPD
jgi:hypothetical protein